MVVFCLCIKAELDGVSKVTLDPRANICISVRNPLSDFETREKVVINPDEIVEAEGKEPESNFTIKYVILFSFSMSFFYHDISFQLHVFIKKKLLNTVSVRSFFSSLLLLKMKKIKNKKQRT